MAASAAVAHLGAAYCGRIGLEAGHVASAEERAWLAEAAETTLAAPATSVGAGERRNAYVAMATAEEFELFLQKKFVSFKRYSGEGSESMMPLLDAIFRAAATGGVSDIVIGEAHRGRLALLVTLLEYPARKLFWKIGGNKDFPSDVWGLDDVTSHVARSVDKVYGASRVHVSLVHNPSHLEAVDPVVVGKTRAKQDGGEARAFAARVWNGVGDKCACVCMRV